MRYLIVLFLFVCSTYYSFGQSRSELENQRNNMLNEISETEHILSDVKKNKDESLELLTLIDKKITTRNNIIDNISKDILKVEDIIKDDENQVNALNSDILNIKKEYAKVLWLSYLNRQKLNQLMYILSAQDINQAYRRLKYLKQYSDYRKRQIKAIQSIQTDLTKKLIELDLQKKEKAKLLSKAETEKKLLSNEIEDKTKIVASLKKREKELTGKIREQGRIADKLKGEIERLIRKEIEASNLRAARLAKAKKSVRNKKSDKRSKSSSVANKNADVAPAITLTPEDADLSSSFRDNRGKLPWPTERGVITGFFGERHHPIYKTLILRNNGIDISANEGAMVRCVFDGEVRCVIPILGANFSVLVRHGNYYTVYTNLIDVKVKTGDKIRTKQLIGRIFTDTNSNTTILHLEVWENLKRLDPQIWLNKY